MVGVAEDIASLIADHASIDRAIAQIRMNRMGDTELNEVINKRISKTPLRLEADARWTIVTLSRGLPYFTQMLTKHAATHAVRSNKINISLDDVEKAMDLFIRDSEQKLQTAYSSATDSNQSDNRFKEVLLACALAKCGPDGFFTPTEVIEPLSAISKKPQTHAHFQRHLLEFISPGRGAILTRRGTGRQFRYRFADPMMPPYAIIKGISEGLIDPASRKRLLEQEQPTLPNVG